MVERLSPETLAGTTLGNYELKQLVDRGQWGPLFLAASKTGSHYMVRVLNTTINLTPDMRLSYLSRFQQEASRIASLQHTHVLPLTDYGTHEGLPFLVYPRVSLSALRSLVDRQAPDARNVGRYLEQIASALEMAHNKGIIHCNLSTNSVFAGDDQNLIVADFGMIRFYEISKQVAGQEGRYTHRLSTEGCAPEQIQGKIADAHTDIYALGAVLYRMLTGHAPFTGNSREDILQQHLTGQLPSVNIWKQGLPPSLNAVLSRAMAKDPQQRFHRPSELVHAYYDALEPKQETALSPEPIALPKMAPVPAPLPTPDALRPLVPNLAPKDAAIRERSKDQIVAKARMASPPSKSGGRVSRRTFITAAAVVGGVGIAGTAAALIIPRLGSPGAVTSAAPTAAPTSAPGQPTQQPTQGQQPTPDTGTGGTPPGPVLAGPGEIAANSAKTIETGGKKGVIVNLGGNNFKAFDRTCTHEACDVDFNPASKLLECPCHGATFDPAQDGALVAGPGNGPLAPIKIVVNSDGSITQG